MADDSRVASRRAQAPITPEELERLRGEAIDLRLARLNAVALDPEAHGWPDRHLAPRRTKRGDSGVVLKDLANALGCNSQALTHHVGTPLGTVAIGTRSVEVYDPGLLFSLRDHPAVIKSREKRALSLTDKERIAELESAFDESTNYRLESVDIEGFRTIDRVRLDLATLTVLVGRNGAGKSSILDALQSGLTSPRPNEVPEELTFVARGEWPGDSARARAVGAYCSIGEPEPTAILLVALIEHLLLHPSLVGRPDAWRAAFSSPLPGAIRDLVDEHLLELSSKSRFIDDLIRTVTTPSGNPYLIVSRLPVRGPAISQTIIGASVSSLEQRLFDELPEIAHSTRHHGIPIARWARPVVGEAPSDDDDLADDDAFDWDEDDLSDADDAEADASPSIRVALRWTTQSGEPTRAGHATHIEVTTELPDGRNFDRRVSIRDSGGLRALLDDLDDLIEPPEVGNGSIELIELALEGLLNRIDIGPDLPPWFSPVEGQRVRTLACMSLVETIANELAPDFVAEAGRILLLPPRHPGATTVGVALIEPDGRLHLLETLSSGIKRWVILLVDFAISLAADRWFAATSGSDGTAGSEDDIASAQELARRLWELPAPGKRSIQLVLADEPELHLHPAAQEDVTRWALRIARTYAVVVATHAPAFLQLSPAEAVLVRVTRDLEQQSVAERLDGDFLNRLDALADDIGLGRERLLQLIRGLVVVEGEADATVLRGFARSILEQFRLALVPIGGHSRSKSLADGDLALAIGLPIAVMFDETTEEALQRLRTDRKAKVSDETKSLDRILALRERGLRCHPLYFSEADIIAAIPEATVCRRFPTFGGWSATVERWRGEGDGLSFKNFVLDSWSVSRRSDLETIQQLVADRRPDDTLPPSITRTINQLAAWAESLGVDRGEAAP